MFLKNRTIFFLFFLEIVFCYAELVLYENVKKLFVHAMEEMTARALIAPSTKMDDPSTAIYCACVH